MRHGSPFGALAVREAVVPSWIVAAIQGVGVWQGAGSSQIHGMG